MFESSRLPAVVFAAGMVAVAGSVEANDARNRNSLTALFSGTTVYTSDLADYHPRDDVWKFRTDGTVVASYTVMTSVPGLKPHYEYGSDRGRWAIEGEAICIRWEKQFGGSRHCYRIKVLQVGEFERRRYRATDVAGNGRWDFTAAR